VSSSVGQDNIVLSKCLSRLALSRESMPSLCACWSAHSATLSIPQIRDVQ